MLVRKNAQNKTFYTGRPRRSICLGIRERGHPARSRRRPACDIAFCLEFPLAVAPIAACLEVKSAHPSGMHMAFLKQIIHSTACTPSLRSAMFSACVRMGVIIIIATIFLSTASAEPQATKTVFCNGLLHNEPVNSIKENDRSEIYFWTSWENFPTQVPVVCRYTISGGNNELLYETSFAQTACQPNWRTWVYYTPALSDPGGEWTFRAYLDEKLYVAKSIKVQPASFGSYTSAAFKDCRFRLLIFAVLFAIVVRVIRNSI